MTQVIDQTLNYVSQGDGYPVILVHGLAASLHDWDNLMPILAKAGYHAFAPDLLGHGASLKPAHQKDYNAENLFHTLDLWIDSLGLKQPPVLVGHSLGGFMSLAYALRRRKKMGGLVLIDPFYSHRQLSPLLSFIYRQPAWIEMALRKVPQQWVQTAMGWDPASANQLSESTRHQNAKDYKRASPFIMHIPATIPDLTLALAGVTLPTTVIWGARDITLDPKSFPALVAALPDAEGHPIKGCGHQPHMCRADEVTPLILQYLAGQVETQ